MNIFKEAKKITEEANNEFIRLSMMGNTWLNHLQEGDTQPTPQNGNSDGNGGNNNNGNNNTNNQPNQNQNQKQESAEDEDQSNQDKVDQVLSQFCNNQANRNFGLIFISDWKDQKFNMNIIASVIFHDGKNILKYTCRDPGVYKSALPIKSLGNPPPQQIKDKAVQGLIQRYKGKINVFMINKSQVEILKQKGYTPAKEDVNLKMLERITKEINEKEGIIYEHIDRLYNDMIATQGSGRLGAFNAG